MFCNPWMDISLSTARVHVLRTTHLHYRRIDGAIGLLYAIHQSSSPDLVCGHALILEDVRIVRQEDLSRRRVEIWIFVFVYEIVVIVGVVQLSVDVRLRDVQRGGDSSDQLRFACRILCCRPSQERGRKYGCLSRLAWVRRAAERDGYLEIICCRKTPSGSWGNPRNEGLSTSPFTSGVMTLFLKSSSDTCRFHHTSQ